jgi:hypothetical protein
MKKKTKPGRKSDRKKRLRIANILTIIFFILLLLLAYLVLKMLGVSVFTQKEIVKVQMDAECSMILGNLIQSVDGEDSCRIKCRADCEIRQMAFYRSEFLKKENDCNLCDCYCR